MKLGKQINKSDINSVKRKMYLVILNKAQDTLTENDYYIANDIWQSVVDVMWEVYITSKEKLHQ